MERQRRLSAVCERLDDGATFAGGVRPDVFWRHRLPSVLGFYQNERPCPADLLCAGPVRRVEDYGYLESHQGPARFGLYDSYGAATHGLRLFAAYAIWSIGISIVFTWPAAVISAVVVSFPLVYRTALGAFESLDAQMLDAARTLGWSERRIFAKLMMPLGWPSIAAGTVLAFARAMGEFGCTLFFAGNYAGITQTIPIAIYFEWMGGNTSVALFWVVVVIAFSFLVILFINMYTAHSQKYRERGLSRAERKQAKGLAGQGDSLDPVGGDALRIDREALAELMRDDAAPRGGR